MYSTTTNQNEYGQEEAEEFDEKLHDFILDIRHESIGWVSQLRFPGL